MSHCPSSGTTSPASASARPLSPLGPVVHVVDDPDHRSVAAPPVSPTTATARRFGVLLSEMYEQLKNPNRPTRVTMKTIEMEYGFYGTPHHVAPGPRLPGADR